MVAPHALILRLAGWCVHPPRFAGAARLQPVAAGRCARRCPHRSARRHRPWRRQSDPVRRAYLRNARKERARNLEKYHLLGVQATERRRRRRRGPRRRRSRAAAPRPPGAVLVIGRRLLVDCRSPASAPPAAPPPRDSRPLARRAARTASRARNARTHRLAPRCQSRRLGLRARTPSESLALGRDVDLVLAVTGLAGHVANRPAGEQVARRRGLLRRRRRCGPSTARACPLTARAALPIAPPSAAAPERLDWPALGRDVDLVLAVAGLAGHAAAVQPAASPRTRRPVCSCSADAGAAWPSTARAPRDRRLRGARAVARSSRRWSGSYRLQMRSRVVGGVPVVAAGDPPSSLRAS